MLIGVLAIGLIGYAIFLACHISGYAGGSDSSGYINSARLLAQGNVFAAPRVLPGHSAGEFGDFSVVPLGFTPRKPGLMAPTYPTGYPLQLIAGAAFGWANAVLVVNLITVLSSGFLLFAYCRKLGLPSGLAGGGVVLLWACPLYIFSAVQPMSDLSALFWTLAALYCAHEARDNWKWGVLCGASVGFAVLVRPTNLVLVVPVMAALGFSPRSWLPVASGGLPAAVFFCFYNWRAYGSPLVTGYGNVWGAFDPQYFVHNLAHFCRWIPVLLSPLIALAALAPFVAAGRQRGFALLVAWAFTLIGLYAFYYHSGETWWYLRFILPAFPVLIIAALTVLDAFWRANRSRLKPTPLIVAMLLLLAVGWQLKQLRGLDVLHTKESERTYRDAAVWAEENLPADSAVFCMQVSGALFSYTDFLLFRWDQIAPEKYGPLINAIHGQHRPIYAVLFPFETISAHERIGGQWTKLATVGQATFWQRQP